jgi:hypothetical protein
MSSQRASAQDRGGLELVEAAVHLLRRAPPTALLAYAIGTLPFVGAGLFFWADMSRSAFAAGHVASSALGLALLFVWMKSWQAAFARSLLAFAAAESPERASARDLLQAALTQAIVQPTGLFVLPVAFALLVPVGWVYAFYQNVTVLGLGRSASLTSVVRRAVAQAKLWPRQNHAALLVVQLLALFVLLNWAALLALSPYLVEKLLGIETEFSRSPWAVFNTTGLMVVLGLTYLTLDPLLKAIYVLRCFHGESLQSAHDLRAELRRLVGLSSRAAAVLAWGVLCGWSTRVVLAAIPPLGEQAVATRSTPDPLAERGGPWLFPPLTSTLSPLRGEGDAEGAPRSASAPGRGGKLSPFTEGARHAASGPLTNSDIQRAPSPLHGERAAARGGNSQAPPHFESAASSVASLAADDLSATIDDVLRRPEFAWRLPRASRPDGNAVSDQGLLRAFLEGVGETLLAILKPVGRWISSVIGWIGRYLRLPPLRPGGGTTWIATLHGTLTLLLAALAVVLTLVLWRVWRRRRARRGETLASPAAPMVDLADERTQADQLPESGWLRLARELLQRGELRLALRAFYLASLALLAERSLLTLAKFKSNRDYELELRRRAHALPQLVSRFADNVAVFDRIWYGGHDVNTPLLTQFVRNVDGLRQDGEP